MCISRFFYFLHGGDLRVERVTLPLLGTRIDKDQEQIVPVGGSVMICQA